MTKQVAGFLLAEFQQILNKVIDRSAAVFRADRSESGASSDLLGMVHHCTSVAGDLLAKSRRHTGYSIKDDPRPK